MTGVITVTVPIEFPVGNLGSHKIVTPFCQNPPYFATNFSASETNKPLTGRLYYIPGNPELAIFKEGPTPESLGIRPLVGPAPESHPIPRFGARPPLV
jgi:hypothetical protein